MHWPTTIVAGLKAAFFGSLIGTCVPSFGTLFFGLTTLDEGIGYALFIIALPFLIGFGASVFALLTVALPLTLWLRDRGGENVRIYMAAGAIAGVILPVMFLLISSGGIGDIFGLILAVFGAMTGSMTGMFWWRYACKPLVEGDTADWAETLA